MRRTITIAIILAIVIGLGVAGYAFLTPKTYNVTEDDTIAEILTIETDTIIATVNATGRLQAMESAQVAFDSAGKVKAVHVAEGDWVKAGATLAEFDTAELADALSLAEIELARAQAQLDNLNRPPDEADVEAAQASLESANVALAELLLGAVTEAEIRAAEAAVESAQANLDKLLSGPSEDSITVAAANLRKTEIALREAQFAYDRVAYDSRGAAAAGGQLEQATIDYESALANFRLAVQEADRADILASQSQIASAESNLEKLQLGATSSQIASAQSQVVQAEANLQALLAGPSQTDLELAEMAIDTAQINADKTRRSLEQATLFSPIDGTVTTVNVKAGDLTAVNEPAINLADLSAFELEVDIDEIDIGRISPGQPVEISLDALPDKVFAGRVVEVGLEPAPEGGGGIVVYPVNVIIDDVDESLKIGLNASVDIETERLVDVAVVPNRAIEVDRQSGQTFVEKLVDDQTTERVEIVLGRRGNEVSQVLEGLEAGDQVIIRTRDRQEELRRAIQGGP